MTHIHKQYYNEPAGNFAIFIARSEDPLEALLTLCQLEIDRLNAIKSGSGEENQDFLYTLSEAVCS